MKFYHVLRIIDLIVLSDAREMNVNYLRIFKFLTGLNFANQPPTIPFFLQRRRDNSSPLVLDVRSSSVSFTRGIPPDLTLKDTLLHVTPVDNATTTTILLRIARANAEYAGEETCESAEVLRNFFVKNPFSSHNTRDLAHFPSTPLPPSSSLSSLCKEKKRDSKRS